MKLDNVEFDETYPNYWEARDPLVIRSLIDFASKAECIGKSALIQHACDGDIIVYAICVRDDLNALQQLCKLDKELRAKGQSDLVIQHMLKSPPTGDIVFNIDLD